MLRTYNTAEEIKQAVLEGKTVFCDSHGYIVINPCKDQWLIKYKGSDYCIGLTWRDNVTLNGKVFWSE